MHSILKSMLLLIMLLSGSTAWSSEDSTDPQIFKPTSITSSETSDQDEENPASVVKEVKTTEAHQSSGNCWVMAANRFKLDPFLLYSMAYVESGFNPYAIGRNKNGSYDLGLMQINSTWKPTLKSYGIDMKDLYNPCVSIHVGAWVLAHNVKRFGYNWTAVGAYNTGKANARGNQYAWKVFKAYNKLLASLKKKSSQVASQP